MQTVGNGADDPRMLFLKNACRCIHVCSSDDLYSINTQLYDYNYMFNRVVKIVHSASLKG